LGRREAPERISINFEQELKKGYVLGWKEAPERIHFAYELNTEYVLGCKEAPEKGGGGVGGQQASKHWKHWKLPRNNWKLYGNHWKHWKLKGFPMFPMISKEFPIIYREFPMFPMF
jgi:hypothetical protein